MDRCLVEHITSSSGVGEVSRPFCYVGFTNEVQELPRGGLGGSAHLRTIEVSCYKFCFSLDRWNILKRIDELGELKTV